MVLQLGFKNALEVACLTCDASKHTCVGVIGHLHFGQDDTTAWPCTRQGLERTVKQDMLTQRHSICAPQSLPVTCGGARTVDWKGRHDVLHEGVGSQTLSGVLLMVIHLTFTSRSGTDIRVGVESADDTCLALSMSIGAVGRPNKQLVAPGTYEGRVDLPFVFHVPQVIDFERGRGDLRGDLRRDLRRVLQNPPHPQTRGDL